MKKLLPLLLSTPLMASIPNYLDVAVGYRNDSLTNHSISGETATGKQVLHEKLNITNFNIYEIGAKVRYEPFCNIFGRGSAYIGWLNGGNYHEEDTIRAHFFDIHAKGNHGQSVDWDLGGGYQFNFFGCVGIAPIFGWSYDYLDIRMKRATSNGEFDPFLSGLRYTSYWNGPFVAVDVYLNAWCFLVNFGYEYHWPHWKGRYLLPVPSDMGVVFSNTRRSHNATGNVYYIDLIYTFCCNWGLGLSYKYFDYTTRGGDFSPNFGNFASQGFPDIKKTDVPRAEWQAHQGTLDLRYSF